MLWSRDTMARDNLIIRPDRPAREPEPASKVLTREERIALLVESILPKVRDALETRAVAPPFKRKP